MKLIETPRGFISSEGLFYKDGMVWSAQPGLNLQVFSRNFGKIHPCASDSSGVIYYETPNGAIVSDAESFVIVVINNDKPPFINSISSMDPKHRKEVIETFETCMAHL